MNEPTIKHNQALDLTERITLFGDWTDYTLAVPFMVGGNINRWTAVNGSIAERTLICFLGWRFPNIWMTKTTCPAVSGPEAEMVKTIWETAYSLPWVDKGWVWKMTTNVLSGGEQ